MKNKKMMLGLVSLSCLGNVCLASCTTDRTSSESSISTIDDNDDNQSSNDSTHNYKVSFKNLADYFCSIPSASSVGIVSKNNGKSKTRHKRLNQMQLVKNLDFESEGEKGSDNVLVCTKKDESDGVQNDENELMNVVFKRIVAGNNSATKSGSFDAYPALEDGKYVINFKIINGLKYDIYDYNGNLVLENFEDNSEYDLNGESGCARFECAYSNEKYSIQYTGKCEEETVTQDEIDGVVDKCIVARNLSFVSFVPRGKSNRPDNISESDKDRFGVINYDRGQYFSNDERQSYVIDNNSGYIYKIDGMTITEIRNNLVLINGLVYDYEITNDFNLRLFPLFTNTQMNVSDYFRDRYGNNYIVNDKIQQFDETTNTQYIIESSDAYLLSQDNELFKVSCGYNGGEIQIKKFNSDRVLTNLSVDKNYSFNAVLPGGMYWPGLLVFSKIQNGFAYFYVQSHAGGGDVDFLLYDILEGKTYQRRMGYIKSWDKNTMNCVWVDDNNFVFYTDLIDGIGKVYKATVWGDPAKVDKSLYTLNSYSSDYQNDIDTFFSYYLNSDYDLAPELLLEDCYLEEWANWDYHLWQMSVSTLASVDYYVIDVSEGEISVINKENYVAPEPDDYVLYPINR